MTKHDQNDHKLRIINPTNPQPDLITEAARIIKKGGVISFPTRCLYGLGADAFNTRAVNRIFKIKQRPHDKPLLILINNQQEIAGLVRYIPPAASAIMDSFWPGRITIVFETKKKLPANLSAGTGKIGIRLTEHAVAHALVNEVGGPITGTSANISGDAGNSLSPGPGSSIADRLDLILDAGQLKGGHGSTIVDVTSDVPVVLREGEVLSTEIFAVLARN